MTIKVASGADWNFEFLEEVYLLGEKIAKEKYKLNFYPNQIEIITSEQMLDCYSSHGLPVFYPHWSYGEQFVKELETYKRGYMGLAYEIVINSNPCIAYLMEENTALMQTLVIMHACFGHNHFFKNNYMFKQWTDAESIIDYLVFAKKYIRDCEEKHGVEAVERIIDACHSLQMQGVDKYKKPSKLSAAQEENLQEEREKYRQSQVNEIWSTIPRTKGHTDSEKDERFPKQPEENILYFIEKNAPRLKEWEREIVRIIRKVAQYFYPQYQTKVMNEGTATTFHYKLIHDLYDQGVIDDGAMQEFYISHTNVVRQLDYDHPYYSGINPYALGFAMFKDIERVSMNPTQEDKDWFGKQEWVGGGDYIKTFHWAIENFKDESFIMQFLSPAVIRDFKMFSILDDDQDPMFEISGIHNNDGYKKIRSTLSQQYNIGYHIPDIQVYDVDRWGDRSLTLRHFMVNRKPLEPEAAALTIKYIQTLWGYPVKLESVDVNGEIRAAYSESGDESLLDVFLDEDSK